MALKTCTWTELNFYGPFFGAHVVVNGLVDNLRESPKRKAWILPLNMGGSCKYEFAPSFLVDIPKSNSYVKAH